MKFTKMQGSGNDYVYIDCFREDVCDPSSLAVKISDRHFGAGSDGLILICPSEKADCRMRMFNLDGSEGEMCGNGIRCVGKYAYERCGINRNPMRVETKAGIKTLYFDIHDDNVERITVNMGKPVIEDTYMLEACERSFCVHGISMGNPHGVTFIEEETANFPVEKYGPVLEKNKVFPCGANIEFIRVINRNELDMRVWERGSGETLACGTGACASTAAAISQGYTDKCVTVHLLGGNLEIEWKEDDGCVYMTGPAEYVYDGEWY